MFVVYDSTFDGLLSAAAYCLRRKLSPIGLISELEPRPILETVAIPCESNIRRLFRRHLQDRLGAENGEMVLDTAYRAFLSEIPDIGTRIWQYLARALELRQDPADRLYEPPVAAVVGAARRVSGQAHQYLGLLRFRSAGTEFYMADFTPDYHVLPLILPHFCDRLADQNFVIRDQRRHLAAVHLADGRVSLHILADDCQPDQAELAEVPDMADLAAAPGRLALADPGRLPGPTDEPAPGHDRQDRPENPVLPNNHGKSATGQLQPLPAGPGDAGDYAAMWQLYLRRLSIPERRNPALQRANLPKKYWKYLTENPSGDD